MQLRHICAGVILCGALVAAAADPLIPPPPSSDADETVLEKAEKSKTLPTPPAPKQEEIRLPIPSTPKGAATTPETATKKIEDGAKKPSPIPPLPDPALSAEPIPFDNPVSPPSSAMSKTAPSVPWQAPTMPGNAPLNLPSATFAAPQFTVPSVPPVMQALPQVQANTAAPFAGIGSAPQALAGGSDPAMPYGMGPVPGVGIPLGIPGAPAAAMDFASPGFGAPAPGVHVRYPYYSYRRPWFTPGPRSVNVNIIW
jgi:hypothetical protein